MKMQFKKSTVSAPESAEEFFIMATQEGRKQMRYRRFRGAWSVLHPIKRKEDTHDETETHTA